MLSIIGTIIRGAGPQEIQRLFFLSYLLPIPSSASSQLHVTPTDLNNAYAVWVPPMAARTQVTRFSVVGTPVRRPVARPARPEHAMASHILVEDDQDSFLTRFTTNGRTTLITSVAIEVANVTNITSTRSSSNLTLIM